MQHFFDSLAIVRGVCWTHCVRPSLQTKFMGIEKLFKKWRTFFFLGGGADSSSSPSPNPATSAYREPDQSSPRPSISYFDDLC